MTESKAESLTLRDDDGQLLGQIVITEDGFFSAVTDYGNFSFAWRNIGEDSFKHFLCGINEDYFAGKMALSMCYSFRVDDKVRKSCRVFANKILPALKKVLNEKEKT